MKEEKCRKFFTVAFQQYRIVGKFQLTEQGFNHISRLVYEVLNLVINNVISLIISTFLNI